MKTLRLSIQDEVAQVVLARPEVHNAFHPEMIGELTQVFRQLSNEKNVRVIVLRGEGKSFCAGADLNWMKSMAQFSYQENQADSEKLFEMFEEMANCPLPVLAKVQGNVFGGGVGLVAVCDIVAAQRDSRFCFSEAKLGLVPAVISPYVLQKVPQHFARQMMMTAQAFGETEALNMGLVHFIGQEEETEDFLQSQIDFILANGPEAVRSIKSLLGELPHQDWKGVKKITTETIAQRRVSPEGQEGLKSFLEKRRPSWKK